MSRINGGSPTTTQSAPKAQAPAPKAQTQAPAPKAQAPAPKSTPTQTQQKADAFDSKSKQTGSTKKADSKPVGPPPERLTQNFSTSGRNQIKKLAESAQAKVTTNKDGSETRTLAGKTNNGKSKTEAELTTSKGMLRESQTKYSKSTTTQTATGSEKKTYTATAQSNKLGLTNTSQTTETSQTRGEATKRGEFTTTEGRTQTQDQLGLKKEAKTDAMSFKKGTDDKHHTTLNQKGTVTTDQFGNRSTTYESSNTKVDDKVTVTKGNKKTTGTELNTATTAKYEDGKYNVGAQADWKKGSSSERSYNKEIERKPSTEDKGFTQKAKSDKLGRAQQAGDLAEAAGAKKTLSKGEIDKSKMVENNRVKGDPNTFVGTRHGYAGKHEVTIGAGGLKASGNIEAKAGLYAEKKSADIDPTKGGAQWSAQAKLEAKASAEGKATINANGLDASGSAKIGVSAEASASGKVQSKSVKVAGEDLSVGAEGTVKVSAQATAEVNAKAKITRNPPTAILEGSAGASAVVKAEAEGKVSAGPFAIKGNIYGSAGAEATAKGSIGYENGKIKISGSLGAAVGLGAGGGVGVEVDVRQIGNMAKNTAKPVIDKAKKVADVNGDGKLDANDATAAVTNVRNTVNNAVTATKNNIQNTARNVQRNVQNTVQTVQRNVQNTVQNVQRNVSNAVDTARNTVNNAVNNARSTVSNAANTVKGWFRW